MTAFKQSLSVTGFILFFLGIVTLTPEIYLSGVMVMLTSASLTIKALEAQRMDDSLGYEAPVPNETYYSW